jgi:CDP-4-dehydro-6-deoxyglucose reductase/ferredoxin-NAD(P)+ reductase (naphthalene dioxygenase ferredoxin-specific)
VGDAVEFEGPFGHSFLRRDHAGPIVAVAGGTGLAPMLSIVRTALQAPQHRLLALYFGVRDEDDVYMEDTLGQLRHDHANFSYEVVLSAPQRSSQRRIALVPQLLLEALDLAGPDTMLYAAGPSVMIDALANVAATIGIPAERLLADRFLPSAVPTQPSFLQQAVASMVQGWGSLLRWR